MKEIASQSKGKNMKTDNHTTFDMGVNQVINIFAINKDGIRYTRQITVRDISISDDSKFLADVIDIGAWEEVSDE